MNVFQLQIVTPNGLIFDEDAQMAVVRTISGDIGIMAGHANYVTSVSAGPAKVITGDGDTKTANCSGGILSVSDGITRIVTDTFEWI